MSWREAAVGASHPFVSQRSSCMLYCWEDEEGEVTGCQSSVFAASGGLSMDTMCLMEDLPMAVRLREFLPFW